MIDGGQLKKSSTFRHRQKALKRPDTQGSRQVLKKEQYFKRDLMSACKAMNSSRPNSMSNNNIHKTQPDSKNYILKENQVEMEMTDFTSNNNNKSVFTIAGRSNANTVMKQGSDLKSKIGSAKVKILS